MEQPNSTMRRCAVSDLDRPISDIARWDVACIRRAAVAVVVGATGGTEFCQPGRILATPEFKADERNRAELKANSFSGGC